MAHTKYVPLPYTASRQVLEGEAKLDSWRSERTGFPEVVFGPGKSPEQIAAIMRKMASNEQVVMATRIAPEARAKLRVRVRVSTHTRPSTTDIAPCASCAGHALLPCCILWRRGTDRWERLVVLPDSAA